VQVELSVVRSVRVLNAEVQPRTLGERSDAPPPTSPNPGSRPVPFVTTLPLFVSSQCSSFCSYNIVKIKYPLLPLSLMISMVHTR
jgi:hypothetical protein